MTQPPAPDDPREPRYSTDPDAARPEQPWARPQNPHPFEPQQGYQPYPYPQTGYGQGGYPPYGYGAPPGYPGYGPRAPRPTNGLAIASLVLGILWLYWVGSILALIFGYVARNQIRERGDGGNGLAVAGIVLGWLGVGVLIAVIVVVIVVSAVGA